MERADLGPVLPPRGAVYNQAHEIAELAKLAMELTTPGQSDLSRAVAQLDKIRVLLGPDSRSTAE
jgi:hypothetical protein